MRPFGVELEYPICASQGVEYLDNFARLENFNLIPWTESPRYWTAKQDLNLEITSPKMTDLKVFKSELKTIMAVVNEMPKSYKVGNFSKIDCGCHIHLDISDLKKGQVAKFIVYFSQVEDIFFKLQPSGREICGYSEPLTDFPFISDLLDDARDNGLKEKYTNRHFEWLYGELDSKEPCLSLQAYEEIGTIEFRMGQSSYKFDRIYNWVVLYYHFATKVIEHIKSDKKLPEIKTLKQLIRFSKIPPSVSKAVSNKDFRRK